MRNKHLWKVLGPIVLSAFSFFISFQIINPISTALGFNLLANKGIGKITFSVMAIFQIFLFLSIYSKNFVDTFLDKTVFMFTERHCFKQCAKYIGVFALLHIIIQALLYFGGFIYFVPAWGQVTPSLVLKVLFSFFVVFLLAWSEEAIFRGMFYTYFVQFFKPMLGIIVTSTIFMLAHDLTNPINLVTRNWKLGLGLFLLGVLLNLIFAVTGKLYNSMGAHIGLVAVKVFVRKVPIIDFLPEQQLPYWVHSDLRQSLLVHLLFIIVITFLIIKHKDSLFNKNNVV